MSYRFKFDDMSDVAMLHLTSQTPQRLNDIFRAANPTYYLKREEGLDKISAMADIDHILGRYEDSRIAWETIHALCPIDPDLPYDAIEIPIQHESWLVPALACLDENLEDDLLKLLVQLMVSAADGISADMFGDGNKFAETNAVSNLMSPKMTEGSYFDCLAYSQN